MEKNQFDEHFIANNQITGASEVQKNKQNLNKILEDCVKQWCQDTTSHGFSNIVRTDSWLIKISWTLLVLASMGYCIYSN